MPSYAVILHLLATVATCGAWLPVWVIHAAIAGNRKTQPQVYVYFPVVPPMQSQPQHPPPQALRRVPVYRKPD